MANVSNAPNDQIFQPHVSRGRRNDRPSLDNIYISGQITTGPKSKFISEAKLRNIRNSSPGTKASNRLDVQEFRRYLEEDDNRKKYQERAAVKNILGYLVKIFHQMNNILVYIQMSVKYIYIYGCRIM